MVLILFAAGLLITYFNSVTTERMLFLDAEDSAELIAAEFNLATSTSTEVEPSILTANARLALRLLPDAEFIGFFKKVGPDSIVLAANAGRTLTKAELEFLRTTFLKSGNVKPPLSAVRTGSSLFSYSILRFGKDQIWGYALTEITLSKVRQVVRRNQETGAIITLLVSVLASILLLFAMRLTFLKPFGDLAGAMRDVAGGNMDARFIPSSGEEFKTISRIFNNMIGDLKKAHEINRTKMLEKEEYNIRLQKEIELATNELKQKTTEIISLQEQLRSFESQAALGKLATKLAHEVGSPLNAIYASVQLLLENDISSEERRKLGVIQRQVENMISIINRALQARKIAVPAKIKSPVRSLIDEVKSVMESKLRETSIRLNVRLDTPELVLNADPVQIQQVLINLINNSIEAITAKRRNGRQETIGLRVYEEKAQGGSQIRINVEDNGGGVSQDIVGQLFVDFINSKKPNGNGIGLVICKEIVESHGGKIFLARTSETGSTFSVLLPGGANEG